MEKEVKLKIFEQELSYIKDANIKSITEDILGEVNDEFFIAPASSTGKYHPSYALGEAGLVRHTKAAVKIAQDLLNLEITYCEPDMHDYIISALILHDTCKSGIDWESKYTKHEHPVLVADLIHKVLTNEDRPHLVNEETYEKEVSRLIASHMGQWNKSPYSDIILPLPIEDEETFVHICDYLASRKYLEVNFDRIYEG